MKEDAKTILAELTLLTESLRRYAGHKFDDEITSRYNRIFECVKRLEGEDSHKEISHEEQVYRFQLPNDAFMSPLWKLENVRWETERNGNVLEVKVLWDEVER